jgi:FHA domain
VEGPYIRIEDTGAVIPLREQVTTIGRGEGVDVHLGDPSVSRLHAEIIRRGPYAYVTDLGLSRNGTRVNGRPVARRVLEDGDVLTFGAARCRMGGIPHEDFSAEVELRRSASPELTRRELDVLTSLCRPALSDEAFVAPATAREIAADLVVTEAAVKQHLLRLYQKFRVPEGANRRVRLANEVVALGLVRPLPPAGRAEPPQSTAQPAAPSATPSPAQSAAQPPASPARRGAGSAGTTANASRSAVSPAAANAAGGHPAGTPGPGAAKAPSSPSSADGSLPDRQAS